MANITKRKRLLRADNQLRLMWSRSLMWSHILLVIIGGFVGFGAMDYVFRPEISKAVSAKYDQVSVGDYHSCAIVNDQIYCWGSNNYGQLGDNTTTQRTSPVAVNTSGVLSGKTVTQVSANGNHTCAVADGQVYCWGLNTNGRLGDDTTTQRTSPVAVDTSGVLSGKTVTQVAVGDSHTCAVADGLAYCWGSNTNGRLGDGTTTQRTSPVAVDTSGVLSGKTVTQVAAGGTHSCAVATNQIYCWGYNSSGQLGDGTTTQRTSPVAVNASGVLSGKIPKQVITGAYHSCTVADDEAYCWGLNSDGQLGDNTTTQRTSPVAVNTSGVLSGKTVTQIATGAASHTCVVANGQAYCWGYNGGKQLGDGTSTSRTVPVAVDVSGALSGKTVEWVAVGGGDHTCVIADELAYCLGSNTYGQIGDGSTAQRASPVAVDNSSFPDPPASQSVSLSQVGYRIYKSADSTTPGAPLAGVNTPAQMTGLDSKFRIRIGVAGSPQFSSVSSGSLHSCAVASGQAYCWGGNASGQLGDGTTINRSTAVATSTSGVLSGKVVTSIATGDGHTCAVADGGAYCWGRNDYGQLGDNSTTQRNSPVAVNASGVLSGKTITSISAGYDSTCAVADGLAYCWGRNHYGQIGDNSTTQRNVPTAVRTSGVLSGRTVTKISTGYHNTCAVADGLAFCWGRNADGQLGDNSTTQRNSPVAVNTSGALSGKVVTDVSAGYYHACAVADGSASCWGRNTYGRLGDNSTTQRNTPVAVSTSGVLSGKAVASVSAGDGHTCVVADSLAYCWGRNDHGRVGDGTTTDSKVPVAVDTSGLLSGKAIVGISAGYHHSCVVSDSQVYCWGDNTDSQLGDGTASVRNSPGSVVVGSALTGRSATQASAGSSHSCAVADGKAYCWGGNASGQLGDDSIVGRSAPVAVDTSGVLLGKTVDSVVAGLSHSCAVAEGKAYCWGDNSSGQLGDNSTTQRNTPVAVNASGALSGKTVTSISAGNLNTCVVADGLAYCWGRNNFGQIGDNSTTQRNVPTAVRTSGVLSGKTVTGISIGDGTTCAVASGLAYCWGRNSDGQVGDNSTTQRNSPVAVNTSGVLSGKTVTDISAGFFNSCAIADGAASCWGRNTYGRLGDGSTTQRNTPVAVDVSGVLSGKTVDDISAGDGHTCVVANSLAYCWGRNDYGQLGDGSGAHSNTAVAVDANGVLMDKKVADISAGFLHSCAIADNQVYCWGDNAEGNIGDDTTTGRNSPAQVSVFASSLAPGILSDQFSARGEFAKLSSASCEVQTTGFSAITNSSVIAFASNSSISNNAAISSHILDPFSSNITSPQVYRSLSGVFGLRTNVSPGMIALFDLSLRDNGAPADTTYCIRLTDADGSIYGMKAFPAIKTAEGQLGVSITDTNGDPISQPSFGLSSAEMKTTCQQVSGTFGTNSQRIRVSNTLSSGSWSLSLSATNGPTAKWEKVGGGTGYDFNDPSGSPPGCNSGSDGDSLAGQLKVDPSVSSISPQSGCSTTGMSRGSLSGFNQGVVDSINLITTSGSTPTSCFWNITGIGLSQMIPASQARGDYTLAVTVTAVAN